MEKSALVILEIIEHGKAPDLKYITINSIGIGNRTDVEFAFDAIDYLRENPNFSQTATITTKSVIRFGDYSAYKLFLDNQFSQFLALQEELDAQEKRNSLYNLEKILTFENTPLESLSDSNEQKILLNLRLKLMDIQSDIASQPEGRIELKRSGNIFITGFSESVRQKISDRLK